MRYILIILLLASCSPQQRFTRLITKYPHLLTTDTVIFHDTISIYIPKVEVDTVVTVESLLDTIYLEKEQLKVKVWMKGDNVYIEGKCDTVYVTKIVERKVPIRTFEKYPWWKKLLNNLLAIFIIFALLYALHRAIKKLP
jgi:hypothetical protein